MQSEIHEINSEKSNYSQSNFEKKSSLCLTEKTKYLTCILNFIITFFLMFYLCYWLEGIVHHSALHYMLKIMISLFLSTCVVLTTYFMCLLGMARKDEKILQNIMQNIIVIISFIVLSTFLMIQTAFHKIVDVFNFLYAKIFCQ